MKTRSAISVLAACTLLTGCVPALVTGTTPSGKTITVKFYPGGMTLDDLVIMDGTNYFGHAIYQIDDPLGDIGFRFEDDRRVQAECTRVGKNIIGDKECKRYKVYRSQFDAIPEGTVFDRPDTF